MGYVQAENPHSVALTQKGLEVAQSVLRKHELLLGFLTEHLGVSAAVAREAACKMEHAIGAPIADKLANFISKLKGAELGDGTCARLCNLGGVRSNCSKRKKRKVFLRNKVRLI